MKILSYTAVDGFDFDKIYKDALNHKPKEIHFLSETEWEFACDKNFIDKIRNLGVNIKIVLSSVYTDFYDEHLKHKGIQKEEVVFWGTYWFNWGAECLKSEIDFTNYQTTLNFSYPYICLNNRSHIHRCAILEELAKQKLIKQGIVTFHDFLEENKEYPFHHFQRQKLILNDEFDKKLDSFIIPDEFHHSFLHIVTEAHSECCLITEKLVKVLLLKKPFLVLGCKHYHKILTSYGFKLYDELFDYTFDNENNLLIRTEKLVNNIHKVLNEDLSKLYNTIQYKINFNYQKTLEIINDKTLIPAEVLQRINRPNVVQTKNDVRNKTLLNRFY